MEWNIDPIIISLGPIQIRWYGLWFAAGFILGYRYFITMYNIEGKPQKELNILLYFLIGGTMIGARLGYCFFYKPQVYLNDPIRIFQIWEGGLASHGGTIGVLLAVFIYTRLRPDQPYIWIADRLSYPIALTAAFIRLGNFFNSEILGKPTDLPWGIVFKRVDNVARHPSMLYESFLYFVIYIILRYLYFKWQKDTPRGLLIGILFVCVFGARLLIELTKENQVFFEDYMLFNMGQLLSIPAIAVGVAFIMHSRKWKKEQTRVL
jgi:prolipoprotein diacylglyceryl transferase